MGNIIKMLLVMLVNFIATVFGALISMRFQNDIYFFIPIFIIVVAVGGTILIKSVEWLCDSWD